jgi:hypothetical protein
LIKEEIKKLNNFQSLVKIKPQHIQN